jgi:hypothetical protein
MIYANIDITKVSLMLLFISSTFHDFLIFSGDEKSQIQALDRTQLGLPMKRGRAETVTHDYKRNGTTTLFAALNTLDGKVIGQCFLVAPRAGAWIEWVTKPGYVQSRSA